jgi:predicted nucleic acid-binding protein
VRWQLGNGRKPRLSNRAERETVHAPAVWPFEFINALWSLERRRSLRLHQVDGAINRAERIGINVHGEPVALHELLDLARRLELAVYDAAYLELARCLGLPLASLDAAQLAAARRAGIATL